MINRAFLFSRPVAQQLPVMDIIAGVEVHYSPAPVEYVCYTSDMMSDDDGSGPQQGDPDYQPDTKLHNNGKALDALVDRYFVVPKQIIQKTKGIVMGCLAQVTRISTGKTVVCVVGDEGAPDKIGEAAECVLTDLGDDGNPVTGGDGSKDFFYEIFPGKPAPGYSLQPA